jgi:hypothetical protein
MRSFCDTPEKTSPDSWEGSPDMTRDGARRVLSATMSIEACLIIQPLIKKSENYKFQIPN